MGRSLSKKLKKAMCIASTLFTLGGTSSLKSEAMSGEEIAKISGGIAGGVVVIGGILFIVKKGKLIPINGNVENAIENAENIHDVSEILVDNIVKQRKEIETLYKNCDKLELEKNNKGLNSKILEKAREKMNKTISDLYKASTRLETSSEKPTKKITEIISKIKGTMSVYSFNYDMNKKTNEVINDVNDDFEGLKRALQYGFLEPETNVCKLYDGFLEYYGIRL